VPVPFRSDVLDTNSFNLCIYRSILVLPSNRPYKYQARKCKHWTTEHGHRTHYSMVFYCEIIFGKCAAV